MLTNFVIDVLVDIFIPVIDYLARLTGHRSYVTCHMSQITCPTSCAIGNRPLFYPMSLDMPNPNFYPISYSMSYLIPPPPAILYFYYIHHDVAALDS